MSLMRVAVANPFCWPEVRRGGERLQYELCRYLAEAGHATALMASRPAEGPAPLVPGAVADRTLPRRGGLLRPEAEFALALRRSLTEEPVGHLHALTHFEAAAATTLPRNRRPRIVAHTIGAPTMGMFRRRPLERLALLRAMRRADEVAVLSRYAHDRLAAGLDRPIHVLPAPVDLNRFPAKERRAEGPLHLLFCGDLGEPRKGARLLIEAFARLQTDLPAARLTLSGPGSAEITTRLLAGLPERVAEQVSCPGPGSLDDLPALYRSADLLVLPSAFEAFGLVLLEALASGTAVVAGLPGGAADIVNSDAIGRGVDLTGPDAVERLCAAIRAAVELAGDPATPAACRARAEVFGWARLGPLYAGLIA